MRPFVALLLLPLVAFAQKDKSNPLDKIDGYKRHTVEGFTLLVSDDVGQGRREQVSTASRWRCWNWS